MQRLGVEEFLERARNGRIIDVRSPAEYQKGHIPGAVNMPIFTNKERAEVGTVYKQQSREEAILLGLDIVGPKLRKIADEGKRQALNNTLHLYCWRGGMRSEKMAWLFDLNGLQTTVLEGGYKNYRQYGSELIKRLAHLVVIQAPTGSGKTEIIRALAELGEQVIDLEDLAHHKGSAFGGLGQDDQPSTQQFQNKIYQLISEFDPAKPVWLESESLTIGRVYLPEELWQRMNEAEIISLNLPLNERVNNILAQYGHFPAEDLIAKVDQLKQKLGGLLVKEISNDIAEGNMALAVGKLLDYYDKTYSYSARKHKMKEPQHIELSRIKATENAGKILNLHKQVMA